MNDITFNGQEILKSLSEKINDAKCPMCGSTKFSVVNGFFNNYFKKVLDGIVNQFNNRYIF